MCQLKDSSVYCTNEIDRFVNVMGSITVERVLTYYGPIRINTHNCGIMDYPY